MKKLLRHALCAGLMTALLAIPAFAADHQSLPQPQGDFYVMVNGEFVTFPDAAPQLKDSRSFLPFVAVFDQLGFDEDSMIWDESTGTVTAVKPDVTYTPSKGGQPQTGDLTVKLTIGSREFTYQYENDMTTDAHGQPVQVVNTCQSDVAPYISNGRTYIPFGLVADALGYQVGWDSTIGAVIIDDVDAIMAANTETYDLMDKYMAYGIAFAKQNQSISGNYNFDLTTTEVNNIPGFDPFTFCYSVLADGKYQTITNGSTSIQFDTDMDISFQLTSPDTEIYESELEQLPAPMSIDMAVRGDVSTGVFYFQSAALAQMMGQPGMADAWYKLDLAGLYNQLGLDYLSLIQPGLSMTQGTTFEEFLTQMLKAAPPASVNATASDSLALINAMFGDSRFVKSGSDYVNTLLMEDGLTFTFTLYTNGSKVTGYAMEMKGDPDVLGSELTVSSAVKGSRMTMEMNVASTSYGDRIDADGTKHENVPLGDLSMTFTLDGTYQSTSKQPETEPPVGATILDIMNPIATNGGGALQG